MSSYDPNKTVNNSGTDPNKGLNTRSFLIAVLVALAVIMLVIFFIAHRSPASITPQRDAKPTSRLVTPQAVPLLAERQASTRLPRA